MKKPNLLKTVSKIENSREFWWILTLALKSPFHGVLDVAQFHSPKKKPCKSPDCFPGGVLDISLGGEERPGPLYPDPV